MTVESDLFDTLKSLVSNRVYPDEAPYGVAKPYIVYFQIGGDAINYTEGGTPDHKNGVFQINVWADTRASASSIMLQVESAIVNAAVFQATVERSPMYEHDADVPIYGAHQDFSIWSVR